MSDDELREINGIKPNLWLEDGEEREVTSKSSRSVYKIKRTLDHYYCTCPAWRNQGGSPVTRSCKHLKALLGETYENARINMKKEGEKAAKPASKSAGKMTAKRKQRGVDEVDEEEGDDVKPPPSKRGRKAPISKLKTLADDVEEEDDDVKPPPAKRGRKAPTSKLKTKADDVEEEDDDVKPPPSKRGRKAPMSKSQTKADDMEEEDDDVKPPPSKRGRKAPTSKLKTITDDVEMEEEDDDVKPPAKRGRKAPILKSQTKADEVEEEDDDVKPPPSKRGRKAPTSKSKAKIKAGDVEEEEQDDDDDDKEAADDDKPSTSRKSVPDLLPNKSDIDNGVDRNSDDELREINGIRPNVWLEDGDVREVNSQSSNSVYKVKRTWDHYYCTCPAWRNQGGSPVNARSCKHLKALLGEKYENARIKMKNPHGPPSKGGKAAKPTSMRKKRGNDEDDDEEEEDDDEPASGKSVPELLLANKWDIETGLDPTGWWVSEKLDGVRTFYDGERFISRLGNPFTPPQWFLDKLPKDITLDGELYGGRREFQSTVSIVKTVNSVHWKNITFQLFDIPSRGDEPFEDRYNLLQEMFGEGGTHAAEQIVVVPQEIVEDRQHVLNKLKEIENLGGEGLMLRRAGSKYEGRRSGTLLKIKTFFDAEAIVTGYVPGKGRNKGVAGALKCKMASGKLFNVGTGLSDKQRQNPPKVGSIITYRFQELTRDGVPRFPSFVGPAADKDAPKDAEIPAQRRAGGTEA